MKYRIAILMILFPAFSYSQTTNKDSLAKVLMNELRETWVLGVDSNSAVVDIGMYNRFKNLFDESATIDDEFNLQYVPGKRSGKYRLAATRKDYDMYAHDVALQLTRFRIDNWKDSLGAFGNSDSAVALIQLSIQADKPARYVFNNVEAMADQVLSFHPDNEFESTKQKTLEQYKDERKKRLMDKMSEHPERIYKFGSVLAMRVVLLYTNDTINPIKIKRIQHVSNALTFVNDDDNDGMLNTDDAQPLVFGDFTTNGTPDADLDGVADSTDRCVRIYGSRYNSGCPGAYFTSAQEFSAAIGAQFNSPGFKLPALNQLGYTDQNGNDAMDVLQSDAGSIRKAPAAAGIFGGVSFTYYPGQRAKQHGVSIGVNYARFTSTIELTSPIVYTYKAFDGVDDYRRQVTINTLKEEITFNTIHIPVEYNYRFKLHGSNSWVMNVKAGPSLMLFSNVSDYNANVDFGGIYQIDTIAKNRITYYNFFNSGSTYNVYLTAKGINSQSTNPGAAAVFAQLHNSAEAYDFASGKNYRDKQQLKRTVIACNVSVAAQYKKNKDNPMALNIGIHMVYAPLPQRKEKYIPIDKTAGEFNSLYKSTAGSAYFAYGIHLGITYNL